MTKAAQKVLDLLKSDPAMRIVFGSTVDVVKIQTSWLNARHSEQVWAHQATTSPSVFFQLQDAGMLIEEADTPGYKVYRLKGVTVEMECFVCRDVTEQEIAENQCCCLTCDCARDLRPQEEIELQQTIQMQNPPSSEAWQAASRRIHELAEIITGKKPQDARG